MSPYRSNKQYKLHEESRAEIGAHTHTCLTFGAAGRGSCFVASCLSCFFVISHRSSSFFLVVSCCVLDNTCVFSYLSIFFVVFYFLCVMSCTSKYELFFYQHYFIGFFTRVFLFIHRVISLRLFVFLYIIVLCFFCIRSFICEMQHVFFFYHTCRVALFSVCIIRLCHDRN